MAYRNYKLLGKKEYITSEEAFQFYRKRAKHRDKPTNYEKKHFEKILNAIYGKISEAVVEYEGGKMGSISMGDDPNLYDGDLIQVEYVDSDGTPVVITLTKDSNGKLLDLDFWKVDFSKLITYPQPHQVSVRPLDAGV